jgi:putative transposase
MDYIHYNPVKHGYAAKPLEWKYSSFAQAVAKGLYERGWGAHEPATILGLECE